MGVDITLNSVWKPFWENFEDSEDYWRAIKRGPDATFEAFRASGGYFRNGYNSSDVMAAIGLSWEMVREMLDARRRLPVERARELIDRIEARPLIRKQYARHLKSYGDGPISKLVDEAIGKPSPLPDIDTAFAFVSKRREQLLAILRKSIELNEPLKVSL
jgi:hypothetical protein